MLYALLTALLMLLAPPAFGTSGSGVTFSGVSAGGSASPPVGGGACTDGADCFCDNRASDPLFLDCEDFEQSTFYVGGANDWSDGQDAGGGLWNRGADSAWTTKYGNGAYETLFKYADGSPTIGTRCSYGPGSPGGGDGCSGNREYCSAAQGALTSAGGADCWGPNVNAKACMDMQRSGDFDAEIGTLTLTGGTGSSADVGAGNTHLAYRVPANPANDNTETACGILGTMGWSDSTEIGVTMLVAYASNLSSADIISGPWKHAEFSGTGGTTYQEFWILGNTGAAGTPGASVFPFNGFMWATSESACNTALSSATQTVGIFDCSSAPALRMAAEAGTGAGQYQQSTDWPFGTWGCVQAHIKGMNTSDVDITISLNETVVIQLDNFDGGALANKFYDRLAWNDYANQNGGTAGYDGTDLTTFRYEDNVYIRNGPPISCADAEFPLE